MRRPGDAVSPGHYPFSSLESDAVKLERHQWHSPALGREMELLLVGHGGARVLVFPTSLGNHHEWVDRRMHEVLGEHLGRGWIQLYCLDQVHGESWYGDHLHPAQRALRHLDYDRYLRDEVVPFTLAQNSNPYLIAAGASFGAYHAACFGFRHPHLVNRIIGMSGLYDVKRLTGGYSDPNVYACNPSDFMRHEHDPARLEAFRRQDIIFVVGQDDPSCQNNRELSAVLWQQGIGNALRIWDGWAHDWPYWERMIRLYIGGHD
jgi:esterase/lipase superfamily enzyme